MTWYSQGEEGRKNVEAEQKRRQEQFDAPRRFWLRPDANTDIVFLDSEGFFLKEHSYKSGGNWQNYETCIADMGEECAFCEDGHRSSYIAVFTVLDLSQFETKDKLKVTASKKLFVLKGLTIKKFLKKRDARKGNITLAKFNTTRYEAKEAATGTDFEFIQKLSVKQAMALRQKTGPYSMKEEEWLQPFDYMKIFAPKSPDELRRILGRPAAVGSDGDIGDAGGRQSSDADPVPDDDIPF